VHCAENRAELRLLTFAEWRAGKCVARMQCVAPLRLAA
jgi:hypothetical protein